MLAMAGALALASFTKASALIFLGSPRTQAAAHAHESGRWMRLPMLALTAMCIALGLMPVLFWPAVARAVGSWDTSWPAAAAPSSLASIGKMQVALALFAVAAAFLLLQKVRSNGLRRGLTWDCAYVAPTAHMQYSSGSFAGIAAGWFAWILRPQSIARKPRGLLPTKAFRLRRVPESVLELVIGPVSRAIMQASRAARRLQHGRLQAYILYVIAALVAMGSVTWMAAGT
jgi:hydrogenase-4 component B